MITDLKLRQPAMTPAGALDWHDRLDAYTDLVAERGATSLTVLEIGVYRASLTEAMFDKLAKRISRYVGVDPYIGDETDPYFLGYWQGKKSVAETTFEATQAICKRLGVELLRMTSEDYWRKTTEQFDLVIIDGDHREEPALADLKAGWPRVKPGGLLLCDDYGNPDHPGVTRAADRFDGSITPAERGCVYTFFHKPPKRNLAYPLGVAWWKKP